LYYFGQPRIKEVGDEYRWSYRGLKLSNIGKTFRANTFVIKNGVVVEADFRIIGSSGGR
jgi:hypothetical protein